MRTLPELDPLRVHAPESHAAFVAAAAHATAVLPAALAADVSLRIAAALGLPADVPGAGAGYAPLVEQFVVYSPGIDEQQREAATAALPDEVGLDTFLYAVYVSDQIARQRLALGRFFAPLAEAPAEPAAAPAAADLPGAVGEVHAAAMRLDRLDPVTTELVRLRAGDYHHCRICAALRLVDAAEAGADEAFLDQRRNFESSSLSAAHKAALRLADAYMANPAGIGEALVEDVRLHFEAAQIVELLLDVSAFNLQKVYVTLGIDAAPTEGDLTLAFDDRGRAVIG